MLLQQAKEEYALAMKAAHRALKASLAEGKEPYPAVLDEILEERDIGPVQELGILDIPTDRIEMRASGIPLPVANIWAGSM